MAADAFSVSRKVVRCTCAGSCVEVRIGFAGQTSVRQRGRAGIANTEADYLLAVSV